MDGESRAENGRISGFILILGQGRPGTNWLFDLLEVSPYTHCRNELR